jgi:microcystin-dependent protein
MADPFVSEIRMFGFTFPPKGWAACDGQLMPISQNTALFALLGTYFGGNGKSNFALPELDGSVPIGQGQGQGLNEYVIGDQGGEESVTLLQAEMPAHNHSLNVSGDLASERQPQGQTFAQGDGVNFYDTQNPTVTLDPRALTINGSSLPHNNMQPYLTMNFCIAMQGVFPPRG